MRSYPLLIDGEDREGEGWVYTVEARALLDDPFPTFDMKRSLELGTVPPEEAPAYVVGRTATCTDAQIDEALESAARAKVEMRRMPFAARRAFAEKVNEMVLERMDEFVDILVAEGHPRRLAEWEGRGVWEGTSPTSIDEYAKHFDVEHFVGDRRLVLTRKPDGVVVLNPPQNAAGSNSALGLPALMAGNALVVKAPRTTPLSVMWLYRDIVQPALEHVEAPRGALNIICGDTRKIIRRWVRSPLVNDVMFFGDSATGIKIGKDCVAHDKKPVLELSGNDGLIVWRDADLDAAATALTECFYGSSQICMVPKWSIVHPAVADELLDRLLERTADIRPGYPDDPDVVLSPVLKGDRYVDFLAEAQQAGAELLTGGHRVDVHGERSDMGFFFEPTVLRVNGLERAAELRCVREETFFPMLPVVVPDAGDDEELLDQFIEFVNSNEYGLRNSLWAADEHVVDRFVHEVVNGGLLKVNDSHIGFAPILSTHGGNGQTGGPMGELHYPILRTTHLQGISVVPHGTMSPDDLMAEVSLPKSVA